MRVSPRPVNVAVGEFFLRGIPDRNHRHVKMQCSPGHRMVRVDMHRLIIRAEHGNDPEVPIVLRLELHSFLDVRHPAERAAGNGIDEFVVALAVRVFGGDGDVDVVARGMSIERILKARDVVVL